MRVFRAEKDKEYVIEFSDLQEFENFFENAERDGSFLLNHPGIPSGSVFRAIALGSLRSRKIKPLKITAEQGSSRVVIFEKMPESNVVLSAEISDEQRAPVKSLAEQLRALTVSERAMLAMKADLAERRVLIQENNPKIQEFLLRNPKLTEPEIAWLAKNPMTSIPTLLTINQHKQWMSADAVRQGILTNPKTPAHIILDKIPYLSAPDLIKMHQSKNLREDIRDQVQRMMKKKGIVIRKDV
jgi:hypothetical protein